MSSFGRTIAKHIPLYSVKHLVCNDAETKRRVYDVQVDEATLREVYLLPFSMAATKESTTPWSVMSA